MRGTGDRILGNAGAGSEEARYEVHLVAGRDAELSQLRAALPAPGGTPIVVLTGTAGVGKTALAGGDPNWGRIVCAAGYSGAAIDASKVDVRVNGLYLCRRGVHAGFDEEVAKKEFDKNELVIRIDLHQGKSDAWVWSCDFTHDYIRINASRS